MTARSPVVSCLMVTRATPDRETLIQKSIRSFERQTYCNRELIIILDGQKPQPDLVKRWRLSIEIRKKIKIMGTDPGHSLGALRNSAVAQASGDWVCQWDDDDVSHPTRLDRQMAESEDCDAVYLRNVIHLFSKENFYVWSDWGDSDGKAHPATGLFKRSVGLKYRESGPLAARGEDLDFMLRLGKKRSIRIWNNPPFLYVYKYHGRNTWHQKHHRAIALAFGRKRSDLPEGPALIEKGLKEAGLTGRPRWATTDGGGIWILTSRRRRRSPE